MYRTETDTGWIETTPSSFGRSEGINLLGAKKVQRTPTRRSECLERLFLSDKEQREMCRVILDFETLSGDSHVLTFR